MIDILQKHSFKIPDYWAASLCDFLHFEPEITNSLGMQVYLCVCVQCTHMRAPAQIHVDTSMCACMLIHVYCVP